MADSVAQIEIRELKKEDNVRLENFFKGLPDDVYDKWNRFGFSVSEFDPKQIAEKQCAKPRAEEVGFAAIKNDGEIVGYSYLRFFPDKVTKSHNASLGIVVASSQQGKGIGEQLMRHMHQWAGRNNIKKIWLATYARNNKALKLYRRLGYEVEGVFMYDEKSKQGWDHVVSMALMLDKVFNQASAERLALIKKIEEGDL